MSRGALRTALTRHQPGGAFTLKHPKLTITDRPPDANTGCQNMVNRQETIPPTPDADIPLWAGGRGEKMVNGRGGTNTAKPVLQVLARRHLQEP